MFLSYPYRGRKTPNRILSMNRNEPAVLVLNSAQSKYPRGDDPWVRATVRAYEQLAGHEVTMVTSADPLMWSFGTFLAAGHGLRIRHVVPDYNPAQAAAAFDTTLSEFEILPERAELEPMATSRSLSRSDVWRMRDLTALQAADVIYPVSIRPGGRLETLLRTEPLHADVRHGFRIDWHDSLLRRTPAYDLLNARLNPLPSGNWLVHWTRTSPGPWPGETKAAFFRDMLARPSMYVRSARETLVHILRERAIRASSWKIPGQVPVVSLTENTPETAVTLMKWRKRFVRYTYEPYGIALHREYLESIGAQRVIYSEHANTPDDGAWMYQSPGMFADWTREREWRLAGDLSLGGLSGKDWFVVVPRKDDKDYVESHCEGLTGRVFVLAGK